MLNSMNLPDYKDGSIVNLMSSIAKVFGSKTQYYPLKGLDEKKLTGKTIVLIVLDGLGYDFLLRYGKKSFLFNNLKGKMTSVFPSTTASAITTFSTGMAPQEHALTGWFMYLQEIKKVTAVLPFVPRGKKKPIKINSRKAKEIYNFKSFFEKIDVPSYAINKKGDANSPYNGVISKGSRQIVYESLPSFFNEIKKIISNNKKRKYVYSYWGGLDSICHRKGTNSQEAVDHFEKIDRGMKLLNDYLKKKNAVAIITADHGLIDTKEKGRMIRLENYPEFTSFLELPLCGEPRVAYCYVKKSKSKQFEKYIKNNFGKMCWLFRSEELIKNDFFGLGKPNKKLARRIGNYVLIMKKNYAIKDYVSGEERKIFIGNHGGISAEEMFVPLIVL